MRAPHELIRELHVPRPLEEVFPFFADAGNLQKLTPPWLEFSILTPQPIVMRRGALIDYRIRVHGWPMRWQSEISVWEPPHRFVDEQRRGPYASWHHEHRFFERDGGTVIRDHVHYAVRGSVLAPLIHRAFVAPDLQRIFDYRTERMRARFLPDTSAVPTASR